MPFPIIPVAIAAAQIGKGIYDQSQGARQTRAAAHANSLIPAKDPQVMRLIDEIEMRQQYSDSGQSRMMAVQSRLIADDQERANRAAVRSAGTSPGVVQQRLLENQLIADRANMQVAANEDAISRSLMAMKTPLITDQADRELAQRQYGRDLLGFQGAQQTMNGNNALMDGIGLLSGLSPEFSKVGDMGATATTTAASAKAASQPTGPLFPDNISTPAQGMRFGLAGDGQSYGAELLKPKGGFELPYTTSF